MERAVVLVVEDEVSVQAMLSAVLTFAGFAVRPARTVAEALSILGTEHIDAMTLDVRLTDPEGLQQSGLTLLSYLRVTPEYVTLPVIIFTGALSLSEAEFAIRHHAFVLYKPQPYSVIIERLKKIMPNVQRPNQVLPDNTRLSAMLPDAPAA